MSLSTSARRSSALLCRGRRSAYPEHSTKTDIYGSPGTTYPTGYTNSSNNRGIINHTNDSFQITDGGTELIVDLTANLQGFKELRVFTMGGDGALPPACRSLPRWRFGRSSAPSSPEVAGGGVSGRLSSTSHRSRTLGPLPGTPLPRGRGAGGEGTSRVPSAARLGHPFRWVRRSQAHHNRTIDKRKVGRRPPPVKHG